MSGSLAPFLKQTWTDSNGNPLSGGKIYSYQAGTTTPQATYTDSSLGTPNTNPVILNAAGQADVWLDPSLSYKFILQDSNGVQQWSVDNVIGLLTANSVGTASLQDRSVTTGKMALLAVDSTILANDASIDLNRAVTTNSIKNSAITNPKIAAGAVNRSTLDPTVIVPPSVQTFLSGSGTYNKNYAFAIASGNATVGATYTSGGITYTVYATVSGANSVIMSGSAAPAASGTLTKASGTGDATLTYSYVVSPAYLRLRMAGGGGGGGGSGGSTSNGGDGGNTTFGTGTCNGGTHGTYGAQLSATNGGSATLGTGWVGVAITGTDGGAGDSGANNQTGGSGGSNPLGGGGKEGQAGQSGRSASANTGCGGGGGGSGSGAGGNGGGAGGYIEAIITAPSATYAYSVGAGGSAGSSAGAGAAGIIIVEEYYQ